MPRYSRAYSAFRSRLGEVEILNAAAKKKEVADPVKLADEINALCRGAIVLLSSHVEAYVKELGEVALDSFYEKRIPRELFSDKLFYHISKDSFDEIKNTSDPEKIAKKIFSFIYSDLEYWSKSGPFNDQIPSDRFNSGFSNPAFSKIKAYFSRFGYETYHHDFYTRLAAEAQPTTNMLDHLVATRNNIAHGDPTATKTPKDIKEMILVISQFCRITDQVFSDWCKVNFCSIRS